MIRYTVNTAYGEVSVSLNARSPNNTAKLKYSGPRKARAFVREWLENAYGLYGHSIGDATTPVDLDSAMLDADPEIFDVQMIEGKEVIESYEGPGIPARAMT